MLKGIQSGDGMPQLNQERLLCQQETPPTHKFSHVASNFNLPVIITLNMLNVHAVCIIHRSYRTLKKNNHANYTN